MLGIAFKLLHLAGDFVDVGEQTAGRFAVETSGGNERVVAFLALRPRLRIQLGPVVPAFCWRIRSEMAPARSGIEGFVLFAFRVHVINKILLCRVSYWEAF